MPSDGGSSNDGGGGRAGSTGSGAGDGGGGEGRGFGGNPAERGVAGPAGPSSDGPSDSGGSVGGWSTGKPGENGQGGYGSPDASSGSTPSTAGSESTGSPAATAETAAPADPRDAIRGMLGYGTQDGSTLAARAAVNGNTVGQQMAQEGVKQGDMFNGDASYNDLRAMRNTVGGKADSPNPGQTLDQAIGIKDYVEPALKGIINVAQMAIPAPIKAGINVATGIANGQDPATAVKDAAMSMLTGKALGAVNQAVGGALGPEAAKALGTYNQAASVANAFGADAPTASLSGIIADKLGLGTPSMTGTRASMSDGSTPDIKVGGWSSGGGGTPVDSAPAAPVAPAAPSSAPVDGLMGNLSQWFNGGARTLKKVGA